MIQLNVIIVCAIYTSEMSYYYSVLCKEQFYRLFHNYILRIIYRCAATIYIKIGSYSDYLVCKTVGKSLFSTIYLTQCTVN